MQGKPPSPSKHGIVSLQIKFLTTFFQHINQYTLIMQRNFSSESNGKFIIKLG